MAQKLEDIRGGGGSIKVGTTGTISALMSRELEPAHRMNSTGNGKLKTGSSADEASSSSSSGTGSLGNRKDPENLRKHRRGGGRAAEGDGDGDGDGDGGGRLRGKKGQGVVEVVDMKCGIPEKIWANPITHRLKKLSFSKLSDANVSG